MFENKKELIKIVFGRYPKVNYNNDIETSNHENNIDILTYL